MALTETFEYDCEVRDTENKAVQVRKFRIIKDGDQEASRTYHRHVLACRNHSGGVVATLTSLARMPAYRRGVHRWTQSIRLGRSCELTHRNFKEADAAQ